MQNALDFRIKTNYTVIRVDDETLIRIMSEVLDLPENEIAFQGKINAEFHQFVPGILNKYKGEHKDKMRVFTGHNIVPSVLRNELATLISGTTVTPTFKANKIAMGSGSTTPLNTDTQLQTETVRASFSDRYAIDNVAYLDKFRSSAEVGGNTYSEIGIFVDGTATVNTGYLLSRILINETMSATETLSVNCTISLA